jgi:hypothetical protein
VKYKMTHTEGFAMVVDECPYEATAEPEQINQQNTANNTNKKS